MTFIQSLPMVAWIAPAAAEHAPGSILDILTKEVATAVRFQQVDANEVRDLVAKNLISFGSGEEAVSIYAEFWEHLRPELWRQEARAREVMAISTARLFNNGREKVKDLLNAPIRPREEANTRLQLIRKRLAQEIEVSGDRRIPSASSTAAGFIDLVREQAAPLYGGAAEPISELLRSLEVDPEDIGSETTLDDIGELVAFRHRLRIIANQIDAPWKEIRQVKMHCIPSWVIQNQLRKHGQVLPERKGSELNDLYLSCLAAYADITYVDKRVKENFQRAKRKSPALNRLVRRVERAAHYSEIPAHL
jgi:hypothetical protein